MNFFKEEEQLEISKQATAWTVSTLVKLVELSIYTPWQSERRHETRLIDVTTSLDTQPASVQRKCGTLLLTTDFDSAGL